MRRATILVLAAILTLGLAAGVMAMGGHGMGGSHGSGWGGQTAQPGYHMGYGSTPNGTGAMSNGPAGRGYGDGYQNGDGRGYGPDNGPGYGSGPNYRRTPVNPGGPAGDLER